MTDKVNVISLEAARLKRGQLPRQPKMTYDEAYDALMSEKWIQALINRELLSRMFGPEAVEQLLRGAEGAEVERRLVNSLLDMDDALSCLNS